MSDIPGFKTTIDSRTPEREASFAASGGCAALVEWLKAKMLDDEGAMINARDHGEWDRYHRLDWHRSGLLHVLHHIRAAQHNSYFACKNDRDSARKQRDTLLAENKELREIAKELFGIAKLGPATTYFEQDMNQQARDNTFTRYTTFLSTHPEK